MRDLFTDSGATFSPCRQYRYRLWRRWSDGPALNACCLNPSTADETTNDPTCERLERRARSWGYGSLIVTNIFAFRATDPRVMKAQADPIGPENDRHIIDAAKEAAIVVCAWGQHGAHRQRSAQVKGLLWSAGIELHALKIAANGEPCHPLYLSYELKPILYGVVSESDIS